MAIIQGFQTKVYRNCSNGSEELYAIEEFTNTCNPMLLTKWPGFSSS